MYQRRSRLSSHQQQKLIELFVSGATARSAAQLAVCHRNSAIKFFMTLREVIVANTKASPMMGGEVEVDESYFGGTRKAKRGRGAAGKVPVFGLLKRGGRVYTVIVPDCAASTLVPIIHEVVTPDSIIYSDCWRGYNALDVSHFHHVRINHETDYGLGPNHINGIENFWSQAKRHMRRFNGIRKETFYLYLKECEWRFNTRNHKTLLNQLKLWYKNVKH